MTKAVSIKCKGSRLLDIDEMQDFQGDLKENTEQDIEDMIAKIERLGFSEPIAVWFHKDVWWPLNGERRRRALTLMRERGYKVPKVPVSEVQAATLKEAKEKALGFLMPHGQVSKSGFNDYVTRFKISKDFLKNIRLPNFTPPKVKQVSFTAKDDDAKSKTKTCPKCGHEF